MKIKLPKMLEAAIFDFLGYDVLCDEEDEEDEDEEIEGDNLIVVNKTKKILMEVQDEWIDRYIIN